jgi:hypothetical protein
MFYLIKRNLTFEPIINAVETCLPPVALMKYCRAMYSSSDSSSNGDCRRHQEEEEEDDYADDAGSQVPFDKEWL